MQPFETTRVISADFAGMVIFVIFAAIVFIVIKYGAKSARNETPPENTNEESETFRRIREEVARRTAQHSRQNERLHNVAAPPPVIPRDRNVPPPVIVPEVQPRILPAKQSPVITAEELFARAAPAAGGFSGESENACDALVAAQVRAVALLEETLSRSNSAVLFNQP